MPFLVALILWFHGALCAAPPPADILGTLGASLAPASPQAQAASDRGEAFLVRGDRSSAEACWKEQLRRGADRGLLCRLGALYFTENRLALAQSCYERLAQGSPESADAWFQLGLVRAARGQYRSAADAQRLAVGHHHDFGRAYCALALDLRESGQTAMGLWASREAIRLLPAYAGAWNLLGNLQQDSGRLDEARLSYLQALRLRPDYAGAWFNLAQLLERDGRPQEARSAYSQALRARPAFGEALLARAQLALDQGMISAARRDFQLCLRVPGWEPEAWWGLHRIDAAGGRHGEAAKDLRRYAAGVRRRDRLLDRQAARGLEQPSPYEPGLPLSLAEEHSAGSLEAHP
jgi:tetratricopeptide (TPR) repeat protein